MTEDESYVVEIIRQNYGISLEIIPRGSVPTPDFRFCCNEKTIFVAELKSIKASTSLHGDDMVSQVRGYW